MKSDAYVKQNKSYAKVTANTPPADQSSQVIYKFIEEFKSILNPLLIAITSLINKISIPVIPTP